MWQCHLRNDPVYSTESEKMITCIYFLSQYQPFYHLSLSQRSSLQASYNHISVDHILCTGVQSYLPRSWSWRIMYSTYKWMMKMSFVKCEWTMYLNPRLSVQTSLRVGGLKREMREIFLGYRAKQELTGDEVYYQHKCY